MKRRFELSSGIDLTITLDIDTDVMTPELAKEINSFWAGADDVLDASEGDVIQAVARRAAGPLLATLLDDWIPQYALDELGKSEGWPEKHGITIVDHDLPNMDSDMWDVEELEVTPA